MVRACPVRDTGLKGYLNKNLFILFIVGLILIVPGFLASCSDPAAIAFEGTVKYIDLEGGFYGIVTDDGKEYSPISLASRYQTDGLQVRVRALPVTDQVNTHQWGTLIKIIDITESTANC
jgi:hypothetical protein